MLEEALYWRGKQAPSLLLMSVEQRIGAAQALIWAAAVAEAERMTILENEDDPSWTEHLANVSGKCETKAYEQIRAVIPGVL